MDINSTTATRPFTQIKCEICQHCAYLQLSDLYGRQKPVSPFSTSSLNCWTQSRKATMAWSNLLSQKNLRPPEQYRGSSWTDREKEGAKLESESVFKNKGRVGHENSICVTLDLSVSDSKYEWFPYGTRRYLKRQVCQCELKFTFICRQTSTTLKYA